jgi:predicted dehydrogenase
VRVGIVGCGFIGGVHSVALRALTAADLVDAAVTATYDADPARAERFAGPHGAAASTSVSEVLERVDAVWVCTWTAAHREVVEAAADAGVAVFCEKPLAPTLGECEAVAAQLERVPHQVGLVLRHAPVFAAAADTVASGRFGRPLATILRDDQYFPIQGMYGSDWRADVSRAGGGTLLEHSIHDVDVLRWILGDPVSVRAHVASMFGHAGIDDAAQVTFGYDGGSTATLVSVWHQVTTRPSTRRLEIICEDAVLWTDDDHLGPLHIEHSGGAETVLGELPPWADRLGIPAEHVAPLVQYAAPTKAFLDVLASGAAARGWPDAGVALAAHRLVDLAYRSSPSPMPGDPMPGDSGSGGPAR